MVDLVALSLFLLISYVASDESPVEYGVDISWPMHHDSVSVNYPWLPHNADPANNPTPHQYKDMALQPLGNIKERYDNYMNGCVKYYDNSKGKNKGHRCWETEYDRWSMSSRQPQSMRNYTKLGFQKIRAPDHVFRLLQDFWNKNKKREKLEKWFPGNIYTNHWETPSYIVSVEDETLEGAGYVLKQHIWNAARDTMEEWTGYKQVECSLYGIRVYKEGAILAPHVDRLPLVASAIINVDQDVDELWPLEVIGHDGKAHNITMLPGDMVLYESHSVIHGRQFPLKGRFMANVFIHFEPVGPIGGQVEYTGDLPPYLIPGSPEEEVWRARNPDGHRYLNSHFQSGSTELHHYANIGDIKALEHSLNQHAELINVRDSNGWIALHEAARTGDKELVQLLLDRGAEVNAKTRFNESVLDIAKQAKYNNEEVIQLLIERGAREFKSAMYEL